VVRGVTNTRANTDADANNQPNTRSQRCANAEPGVVANPDGSAYAVAGINSTANTDADT
jgi:hypothetical protein